MRIICVEPGAEIKPSNGTLQSLINLEQKTKAVDVPFWQYPEFLHNFIPFWCVISEQRPLNWSPGIDRERWKYDGKKLLFDCSEIQGGKQEAQRRKAKI